MTDESEICKNVELEMRLEAELARVTGHAAHVWTIHRGHAWVRWGDRIDNVYLYHVENALAVLAEYEDGQAASEPGCNHLVLDFENDGVFVHDLRSFPWWKLLP